MNRTDSKTPAAAAVAAAAKPSEEMLAKLGALRAENSQAAQELASAFGSERWAKLVRQCEGQGMNADDVASLCGKMRRTGREWHPGNDAAALQGACNGFLCAVGSVPTEDDVKAYDRALKPEL